jgi:hypothetical protein
LDIRSLPSTSGIPDGVMGVIVGSRRSILFVEGEAASLDISLYRRVYDQYTIIPLGSCEAVIHAVASFRENGQLHHLSCAGIVDLDGRTSSQVKALEKKGVKALPVSEVENILLLPSVFKEVAKAFHFSAEELDDKVAALETVICEQASSSAQGAALRFARRQIDASMKAVDLKGKDAAEIQSRLTSAIGSIDIVKLAGDREKEIHEAIAKRDTPKLLALIDQKGLLSEAAKILGAENRKRLEEFVGRSLSSTTGESLRQELLQALPSV